MQNIAKYRNAKCSGQKIRIVANLIRGKEVSQALKILNFNKKKSSTLIKKVLQSAIANAKNNNGIINTDNLKIQQIFIDKGLTMKRFMPRAKGRSDQILKRTSNITIIISD
ncbi:MAG: 50S ribosomal protein L22 [Candidatus Dasytiphilus stammeri]